MKWLMRRCVKCRRYTLKENCPDCGEKTTIPHPPKFSPQDKYARYKVQPKTESASEKLLPDSDGR